MSKRLQVLFEESEYRELEAVARREGATVSEWVRQTLRLARKRAPTRDADRKLAAVRAATQHRFPVSDVESMLSEIERGYLGDPAE